MKVERMMALHRDFPIRDARPGDCFTGPDGVELVVVPRVATAAMSKAYDKASLDEQSNEFVCVTAGCALSALLSVVESSDDKG